MSEYQYYEFQAVDRPLTEREMRELRGYSTRATITSTRFVNHYEWGSFKGNPSAWMERYFDAFLYLANWGTRELILRLPRQVLDLKTARPYLASEAASARAKGGHIILEFRSDGDDGDGWDDDGSGWLSSLIPVRADLASADFRALYLAWLLSVPLDEGDDGVLEPPVPAGLDQLSAPLKAFAEFLRIDEDLITVAAERSAPFAKGVSGKQVQRWVAALPEAEKTALLVRVLAGEERLLRAELLSRYRHEGQHAGAATRPRTVSELRSAAERRAEERHRKEAERATREKARRAREEAAARETYLKRLAKREPAVWQEIDALITKRPAGYDEAIKLLGDLKDVGAQSGRLAEVLVRIQHIRDEHSKKSGFVARLRRAGLLAPVDPPPDFLR